jgi:hypothetical protein
MRKTLFISLIISSLSATAIVVRHDVADEKYLAKGINLPQIGLSDCHRISLNVS